MYYMFGKLLKKRAIVCCRIKSVCNFCQNNNIVNTIENMTTSNKALEAKPKFPVCSTRLEVIGSGAYGGSSSVHLFTSNVRYLFNCGEGTQRLCYEYKVKIAKIPYVFITYPSWKNIAGLFGMMLDLQSVGTQTVQIHGHPCIANIFTATNRFVALRKISIQLEDCFEKKEFSDGTIKIKYVFLYPSAESLSKNLSESEIPSSGQRNIGNSSIKESEKSIEDYEDDDIDYYSYLSENSKRKRNRIIVKHKHEKRSRSEAGHGMNLMKEKFAISYICQTKEILGTLLIEKCISLGLKPGPILGQLKKGEDVTLENGVVIKSSDVKSPNIPGDIIIFVECPSEDYLESLLKEPSFFRHQTNKSNPELLATVVVHFTSCEIMENSKYKEWMNRFPKTTKHVIVNESNKWTGSVAVHSVQHKLNLVHSDIFPILHENEILFQLNENVEEVENPEEIEVLNCIEQQERNNSKMNEECEEEEEKAVTRTFHTRKGDAVIKGDTMCLVYLKPKQLYDYSKLFVAKNVFLNEVFQNEGFSEELENLKFKLKEVEPVLKLNKNIYPKILFLGTGSSKPSKTRNTSGILVFLDEKNCVILDCGEATYCQLVRFFGKEKSKEVLRNLKAIFVSHLHPDHHLGLISILIERRKLFMNVNGSDSDVPDGNHEFKSTSVSEKNNVLNNRLYILGPHHLLNWLNDVDSHFENISDAYEMISNAKFLPEKQNEAPPEVLKLTNLEKICTAYVQHCANAFGIAITHSNGWKLTYSGDTMPCENLIKIGENSDVLIHEATMDDSLEHEARRKFHSTNAQAIEIGRKMNAKFTLLTHFSQRYHYSPIFNECFTENVGVAYDNMMVCANQLKVLPKLTDALKLVFLEHYEKLEENIYKNKIKNSKMTCTESPEKIRYPLASA